MPGFSQSDDEHGSTAEQFANADISHARSFFRAGTGQRGKLCPLVKPLATAFYRRPFICRVIEANLMEIRGRRWKFKLEKTESWVEDEKSSQCLYKLEKKEGNCDRLEEVKEEEGGGRPGPFTTSDAVPAMQPAMQPAFLRSSRARFAFVFV